MEKYGSIERVDSGRAERTSSSVEKHVSAGTRASHERRTYDMHRPQ